MKIVILTGSGISAESGIPTFRGSDGLWNGFKVEDVATPEGFKKNKQLVLDFYNSRRKDVKSVVPNDAHFAIAKLQNSGLHDVTLITQNVDDLHERAGSKNVFHMHGSLANALCSHCGEVFPANEVMMVEDVCAECGEKTVRPDIVWFGEIPYYMDEIDYKLRDADIFVSIGTSGNVYPAAGFVKIAKKKKAKTVELNLEPTGGYHDFSERKIGLATKVVPEWVDDILKM